MKKYIFHFEKIITSYRREAIIQSARKIRGELSLKITPDYNRILISRGRWKISKKREEEGGANNDVRFTEVWPGQVLDVATPRSSSYVLLSPVRGRENVLAKYPVAHPAFPVWEGIEEGVVARHPYTWVSALCYRWWVSGRGWEARTFKMQIRKRKRERGREREKVKYRTRTYKRKRVG